jgi:hypothetical protein
MHEFKDLKFADLTKTLHHSQNKILILYIMGKVK